MLLMQTVSKGSAGVSRPGFCGLTGHRATASNGKISIRNTTGLPVTAVTRNHEYLNLMNKTLLLAFMIYIY